MNKNNPRGVAYFPAIFIVIAIVAAVGVGYVLIKQPFTEETDTTTTTNVGVNENTNTPLNSNANTNAPTNTNTAALPEVTEHYAAPVGPFTTTSAKVVAFSYAKSSDQLVTRLAKVNAATGKIVETAQLSTIDLQTTLDLPVVPNRPSFFRFGSDGDSVLFVMSGSSPYPFTGLYRTSFSTPKKVETILQYDKDHLLNGDIPSITDVLYNAETNTAAFVIPGDQSGERNQMLKSVTFADKQIHDLGSYSIQPQLVGFPANGTLLEVLYSDKQHYQNGQQQKVKWFYDQIRLSDGTVTVTKLLIDEASITDAEGTPYVSLMPDSISPNNQLVAFNYNRKTSEYASANTLAFRNVVTGEITPNTVAGFQGGGSFPWSPDNGKMLLRTYSRKEQKTFGTIFDLAKGSVVDITDFGQGLLWYPADLIVFTTSSNTLASYNPTTKKRLSIFSEAVPGNYGGYGEYGGSAGNLGGIRWVNR